MYRGLCGCRARELFPDPVELLRSLPPLVGRDPRPAPYFVPQPTQPGPAALRREPQARASCCPLPHPWRLFAVRDDVALRARELREAVFPILVNTRCRLPFPAA